MEIILVKNYYYLIKNVFLEILYIVNMFLFIYDSCEEEKIRLFLFWIMLIVMFIDCLEIVIYFGKLNWVKLN